MAFLQYLVVVEIHKIVEDSSFKETKKNEEKFLVCIQVAKELFEFSFIIQHQFPGLYYSTNTYNFRGIKLNHSRKMRSKDEKCLEKKIFINK